MEKSLWDRTGDVGGLDAITRQSIFRGPEKKKRKSSIQGIAFPPLSEYAPPTNTSSNHLIASNPFDDDYSASSLSGYSYFAKPGKFETFNNFKMPPNTSPKRPSRNSVPQSFRNQSLPFSSDIKGMLMGKAFSFNGEMDKSNYETESFFNGGLGQTIVMPGQHFRPNHNQDVYHMTSLDSGQRNDFQLSSYKTQGGKVNFNHPVESNIQFPPTQPQFMHRRMSNPKHEMITVPGRTFNLNSATSEEKSNLDLYYSPKNTKSNRRQLSGQQLSDTVDLTGANETHSRSPRPSKCDVTPTEKCNRWLSSFCSSLSEDTLYPCGICYIDVNNVEDAIMCEVSCQKWFHRSCTGLTEIAYTLLTTEASAIWGCDSCMAKKDVQLVYIQK